MDNKLPTWLQIALGLIAASAVVTAAVLNIRNTLAGKKADFPFRGWEQQRQDNQSLREEIKRLEEKMDAMDEKLSASIRSRDQIEEDLHKERIKSRELELQLIDVKEKLENEQVIAKMFSNLYDMWVDGQVPDRGMLDLAEDKLSRAGYLVRNANGTSHLVSLPGIILKVSESGEDRERNASNS